MFKTIQEMKVREDRGFTLIELLIVVAIIGILAAIAIPAFLGQQKKAKWRALQSSCDGASKQAGTMLMGLATLEPIVLLQDPSKRLCFAHNTKTLVDSNADGTPEKEACSAKFREVFDLQGGQGKYGVTAGSEVKDLVNGLTAEACGDLTPAAAGDIALGVPIANPGPFKGLLKTSPYNETKCLYSVKAAPYAVVENEEGTCVMEYNEGAKTVRLIAIEDDGKAGSWGETKVWVATGE